MGYKLRRSRASLADLKALGRWLIDTHLGFGYSTEEAVARATKRLKSIHDDMQSLARSPYQGTLCDDVLPGLRRVTKDRVIIYFRPDETTETLLVLAVFFGGQDHLNHARRRFPSRPEQV
jgi:plasmid stabilization system protein ParE